MSAGESGRRVSLLERADELAQLERILSVAREGQGSVVLIESYAGRGKSALLRAAGQIARADGMTVLEARASGLETGYPFALAIKLFEPRRLIRASPQWTKLASGPAELARNLLERAPVEVSHSQQEHSLIRGLFLLATELVSTPGEERSDTPLVLLVDDAHWADRESLRFLAYLAERIRELGVVLIATIRPDECETDPGALRYLASLPDVTRVRLSPLSESAAGALVRDVLPGAEAEFASACAELTRGNPLFLVELLAHVRAEGLPPDKNTVERLGALAPESIVEALVARLHAMPAEARGLITAVVVLGDGASLHQAAQLADLPAHAAARAADALTAVYLLRPGEPLSFVHPIARAAVRASLSPLTLGYAHRRAAILLDEEGADPEIVAAHFADAPPGDDPRAVRALFAAARNEVARGAPRRASALLERAIAERPPSDERAELLAELARAELLAGSPEASLRVSEAMQLTDHPHRRAELTLIQAESLYREGRFAEAASALDDALANTELDDPALVRELEAAYLCAGALVPGLTDELGSRRRRLLGTPPDQLNGGQRLAVAHLAMRDGLLGEDHRLVRRLADLAWGDGALVRGDGALLRTDGSELRGCHLLSAALLFVDELERAVDLGNAALAIATGRGSKALRARAQYSRVWSLFEQGRISDAAAAAAATLDAEAQWQTTFRTAYGAIACCHVQRGELDAAAQALATTDEVEIRRSLHYPFLLDVRAQLRLAQHRAPEALSDALHAGQELESRVPGAGLGVIAWRSTAALAHLALGQRGRAADLAAEELEIAQRTGITRIVIKDLRALGLAVGGSAGIELLEQAVKTGARYPVRLEYMYALVDLGAALRRVKQRAAAREPLRKALELCYSRDATALAARAETELAATGARVRSALLSGFDALTPSEQRVAELGAQGLTTRQMAEALFVTPKTIEYHLRNIYRKLDISSREDLAETLGSRGTEPSQDLRLISPSARTDLVD